MNSVIVADIGGTNARFGLVTGFDAGPGQVSVEQKRQYPSADFRTLPARLNATAIPLLALTQHRLVLPSPVRSKATASG